MAGGLPESSCPRSSRASTAFCATRKTWMAGTSPAMTRRGVVCSSSPSHVHPGGERVLLDEVAAGLDQLAHQLGKDVVGLVDLLDLHLQERAGVDVERRLPQLARVHLAESLVALQRHAFAAGGGGGLEQADRAVDRRVL